MPTSDEILDQAKKLLREGQVQAADDLISQFQEQSAIAAAAASGVPPTPPPPRSPMEVITDILTKVVALLGNAGPLEELIAELRKVL